MKSVNWNQVSSKKKKIVIASAMLVLLIVLGVGLGVGLSGTSEAPSNTINTSDDKKDEKEDDKKGSGTGGDGATTNPGNNGSGITDPDPDKEITTEPDPVTLPERDNYTFTEKDGEDNKKEVTIRFKENKTLEQIKTEVDNLKTDLEDKTLVDLKLPFAIKSEFETTDATTNETKIDVVKIKSELGIDITEDKAGFIFYPSDDKDITYENQNIVEVVLSTDKTKIMEKKFKNNRIKKVNWDELVNLETIESNAFGINDLEGELDLSKLVNLKTIKSYAFQQNKLKGILTLPPSIEVIGAFAFSVNLRDIIGSKRTVQNKISGTLKLPENLKTIGYGAFTSMEISEIDWSEANKLEEIGDNVFFENKLTSLAFSKTSLPNLHTIKGDAFRNNSEYLLEGVVEMPINLLNIGLNALKVKDGTKIYVSPKANGISKGSFEGNVIIEKYST